MLLPRNAGEWGRIGLSNIATLVVALIAVRQMAVQVEPDYVATLQLENTALRSEIAQLTATQIESAIRISELERLAGGTALEIESGAVYAFIDGVGRPAWCKRVEYDVDNKPQFLMAGLNNAYELKYNVTSEFYTGKTDFETQDDPRVAQAYYANDYRTWLRRQYTEFLEPAGSLGNPQGRYGKWWIKLPVSEVELICGLEVGP